MDKMMSNNKKFSIIAAVCHNNGIGNKGSLPWKLKKEMSYFTRTTSNANNGKQNAVIMGRKTWESIPAKFRPLSNRINVLLSKTLEELPKGANYMFRSLCESLEELSKNTLIDKIYVIGGESVYREAILKPECEKVYLTIIDTYFECDSHFPQVDQNYFQNVTHEDYTIPQDIQQENGIKYQFFLYKRKSFNPK